MHKLSCFVLACFLASHTLRSAVIYVEQVPPQFDDTHLYDVSGDFYFESWDMLWGSDWNQQIETTWNSLIPSYNHEVDYVLSQGDYFIDHYDWSIYPAILYRSVNGDLYAQYTWPHPLVRIPFALNTQVCTGWTDWDPELYPWNFIGQNRTTIRPNREGQYHYIYEIEMSARAYSYGMPFRDGNGLSFNTPLPSQAFTVAGRLIEPNDRYYLVLNDAATEDITPIGPSTWYHYTVAAHKLELSNTFESVGFIARRDSDGTLGISFEIWDVYVTLLGNNALGYHAFPANFAYLTGVQLSAQVPYMEGLDMRYSRLANGWHWGQDVHGGAWYWKAGASSVIRIGYGKVQDPLSPPNWPGSDTDAHDDQDHVRDDLGFLYALDAPGIVIPPSLFNNAPPGSLFVARQATDTWTAWTDPVTGIQGIGSFVGWGHDVVIQKVNGVPVKRRSGIIANNQYKDFTAYEAKQIALQYQ